MASFNPDRQIPCVRTNLRKLYCLATSQNIKLSLLDFFRFKIKKITNEIICIQINVNKMHNLVIDLLLKSSY